MATLRAAFPQQQILPPATHTLAAPAAVPLPAVVLLSRVLDEGPGQLIFAQLPVDSRLRCREVCRGWRAFLADARHWQVLDLSLSSGVARRTVALLCAASERARGTLRELDVSGWFCMPVEEGEEELKDEQLEAILRANSASLLELCAWKPVVPGEYDSATTLGIEDLLTAAPRVRLLECDAALVGDEARGPLPRLLHKPHFSPLRIRQLFLNAKDVQPPPDVPALAAWAATHASLKRLELFFVGLDSEAVLDAVVNLAVSQLQVLTLYSCSLSPASLPGLSRVLASRTVTQLCLVNENEPLLVGAAVPAFCAALRASRLVRLSLVKMRLWESPVDSLAVIAACTGHPTLRDISFRFNDLEDSPGRAAIDAAMDALEASSPELLLRAS